MNSGTLLIGYENNSKLLIVELYSLSVITYTLQHQFTFSDGKERELIFDKSKNFLFMVTKAFPTILTVLHVGVFIPSNSTPSQAYDKQSLTKKFDYIREFQESKMNFGVPISGLWFRHLRAKPKN